MQSNSVSFYGGGILGYGGSSTLTSCSLTSNRAANGGAIYNYNDHTSTLTNCSLQSNSATTNGGGIANDDRGSSTLTSCSLTSNQAGSDGGAIYNFDHTATLTNCSLQNNSATNNGGGLYNERGSSTLTGCSLTSNRAANGGAIYNLNDHTATLTNSNLQSNSVTFGGGGMVNIGGSSTLTSCSLTTNQAGSDAGGIYNLNHTATLTNCSLQSNSATLDGGGIFNVGGSNTLTNCSLQSNQANVGGAIYNDNSSPVLTNCVLFGNNGANTFANVNSSTLTATYSLFEPSALVAGVNVSGPGNLTTLTNPFVSANSVALAACSPAINACLNAANTTTVDLVGNPRVVEGRIDMGAIEYQGTTTLAIGITANPSLTIIQGQTTTLTASGGSSYSWSSGQSTTTIVVSVAGPYTVTGVTGSCSGTATVMVSITAAPPSITAQPASVSTVCAGASVMVTVGVSGSISGYQWLKGGSPVAGQTGPTLSLGNVQVSDTGVYSLSVTGPGGATTSNGFTLTVNPLPTVTLLVPSNLTVQGPGSGIATITVPANGLPTTFQATGGQSYERVIILDRVNGFEIRQVDQNTTGIFSITRPGLFTLTATGANGCSRTVQGVIATR